MRPMRPRLEDRASSAPLARRSAAGASVAHAAGARTFLSAALCSLAVISSGCLAGPDDELEAESLDADPVPTPDDRPTPPPVGDGLTGRWTGTFTTSNAIASKGTFSFDLTETIADHAVTGPFSGTVTEGATGTAFKGTFSGVRSESVLNGKVVILEPVGVTGDFQFANAIISGDGDRTISGDFDIAVSYSGLPITAQGGCSISR